MLRLRQHAALLVSLFAGYWCVWVACNWSGVAHPWWYMDDFGQPWPPSSIVTVGLAHGNPIGWLWYFSFLLDGGSGHAEAWNVALRCAQGVAHCLGAAIAATLLWGTVRSRAALLCLLPFLIWPFNAEAILWRSAGYYPIAALLGFAGVWCLEGGDSRLENATGVCLLAVAMLTSQVAALSGLTLEVLVCGMRLFEGSFEGRRRRRIVLLTLLGYLIGGFVSLICTQLYPNERAALAVSSLEKLYYLGTLNRLLVSGFGFYPVLLFALHILVLVLPILIIGVGTMRKCLSSPQQKWIAVGLLSLTSVTPYLSVLLVAESWPAWRVMYLGPLLVTSSWWLLDRSVQGGKVGSVVSLGLLALILAGYAGIGRVNASEYVRVFRRDLRVLRKVEAIASAKNTRRIVVQAPRRNWHRAEYMHGNSKVTAFHEDWSACAFVQQFSMLQPSCSSASRNRCATACGGAAWDRKIAATYTHLDDEVVCVCRRGLRPSR